MRRIQLPKSNLTQRAGLATRMPDKRITALLKFESLGVSEDDDAPVLRTRDLVVQSKHSSKEIGRRCEVRTRRCASTRNSWTPDWCIVENSKVHVPTANDNQLPDSV